MKPFGTLVASAMLAALFAPAATAQIRPQSSGQPSFNSPQMRRHGSGLYRPNRPHHHHRHHRHHYNGFFR